MNRYIFQMLRQIEKGYYELPYVIRHVVGSLILIVMLATVIGLGYGAYYGVNMGWRWAREVCYSLFVDDGTPAEEYSETTLSHHEFPIADKDKQPKRRINYHKDFGYINDVHLAAAMKLGIKPIESREDFIEQESKLVKLKDTRYYQILPLNSSIPYLVPRAADFLTALGKLMQEYNGTHSRFYLSSVLRTQEDVKRLGRINGNASKNSTHCYGTTVDITYSRFDVRGRTTEQQLKLDLARALYDLQAQGYCYVKYEIKQPFFHITVRPEKR